MRSPVRKAKKPGSFWTRYIGVSLLFALVVMVFSVEIGLGMLIVLGITTLFVKMTAYTLSVLNQKRE